MLGRGAIHAHRGDLATIAQRLSAAPDLLAFTVVGAVAAGKAQPRGHRGMLFEQPSKNEGLLQARQGLEGEHIRAGPRQYLEPRPMELGELAVAEAVVSAV